MTPGLPSARPRILLAPLDWGLGHATRCIPLIRAFLQAGAEVIVAGEGPVRTLLAAEFPSLAFLDLPGYRIRYRRRFLKGSILLQLPKIFRAVAREHRWLEQLLQTQHIDAVISDNRYGLHTNRCHSVIITHQLDIRTGLGSFADRLTRIMHYRQLKKFGECWVPDAAGEKNISGALGHPEVLPQMPLRYTGVLSRFETRQGSEEKMLLVILSGPEPHRSLLEAELFPQLETWNGKVTVVRGMPGTESLPAAQPHMTIFNHLPANGLRALLEEAAVVISRSGYSTLMDLARMTKKSILIPTPGQAEQEYLADLMMKKGWAFSVVQGRLDLPAAIASVMNKNLRMPYFDDDAMHQAVAALLQEINIRKEVREPA